jgi:hypothetical protein
MADIFCPVCGKANPSELEKCQFCGSKLKPFASSYFDAAPIKPGENPVIRNTSEFEKVKLTTSDLVHPGVEPTVKSTAALESTLPSWLRSLRKTEDAAEGKSTDDSSPDQRLPLSLSPEVAAESTDDQPDWLPEPGKGLSDDEKDVPDWLTSLREEKPDTSAQESLSLQDRALNTTGSLSAGVADAEWIARLGGEPKPETPEAKPEGDIQGKPESLDWLDSIGTEPAGSSMGDNPVAEQDDALHDWLSTLPPSPEVEQPASGEKENLPDWQEQTQEKIVEPEPTTLGEKENSPEWQEISQEKIIEPEPTLGERDKTPAEFEIPDWLSNLGSMPAKAEEHPEENLPDWLAAMESKPGPEPGVPAPVPAADISPASSDEIPSWLSQYQAEAAAAEQQEATKEQSDSASPSSSSREGTGPLPEWLVGIEKNQSASGATPALVTNEEVPATGETTGAGFSLEMPDWISKLNPEQASEKASGAVTGPSNPENLELSELPSWVQAMRPVESVMAETKETPQEEPQVTEQTGPLAGLQGVLPASPGLGTLRKPPAYSAILNVTEGQQRYAAAFEKMISGETLPQAAGKARLTSNRVWRWVITILLLAAVVAPLLTGIPATPASTLRPPETVSAFTLIGSLPSNAAVLVIFDYDPALSGEMEAAAAPLMDHLLLQGPRLALISTSPTGPALAERFLHDTNASPLIAGHNYQSGQQYVNLGYLAGGPSGIQYFAASPSKAAQFTLDGQQAWTLPPLQGVRVLSDFAAIVVITDNADSGRVWIEQTGSTIGNTPILMVLSAQAEPMILPYYASGQVKGLVTGLAGGDAYGQIFARPDSTRGLAEKYWNSFGVGTLVAEILIVIGAIWSAVAGWRSRRGKSGEKV